MRKMKKDVNTEKYGLVYEIHPEGPSDAKLVEIADLRIDNGGQDNILIEGENLDALNILKNDYSGRIDVICIDPPYNTGMNWLTYQDHEYMDNHDSYSHSKWLSFMNNRMKMAYSLLSENGVLFVNIDENEIGTLLLLCHQIFGEGNVDVLIWPKTDPKFDMNRKEKPIRDIKIVHEYIFVCFKNRETTKLNKILIPVQKDGEYIDAFSTVETILTGLGTTSSAKDEMEKMLGDRSKFQTPKPMRLFKELIRAASKQTSIVLDFFAGSGTTGHAVMDLNRDDNGERQFILINNKDNNICRQITYERIKKAINDEQYLASLKYFRTAY
ncbi:MAG: site-specific DNA-methyltransferase [Planctomycetes bacterium]|nr:site-specific DNA-methyltransferase [Planctomycetota bacterium]